MEHMAKESEKEKIRNRYKGISQDMLETIPAVEHVDILHDDSEKRVGVYVRVSTDDPRQTSSFELQRNHYTDLIDRYPNWHLYDIYADEGISGTSLKHRKAFLRMIEDCKQHKLDLIVTKSVSRFARNIYHCIGYVRELAALKPPVGVLFETEGLYTLKDESEMALSFTATFAQEESRTRSSAMNLSYEMRFRRGIFMLPELLGYDKDEEGIADHFTDADAVVFVVELKVNDVPFSQEVLLEAVVKLPVMRGRQPDKQRDIHRIDGIGFDACSLHLIRDGKQRKDIKAIVLGLVPEIRDSLFCQRIVSAFPVNEIALKARPGLGFDEARREQEIGRLDALVPVVD